jgi:hypothetical protein
VCACLTQSMMMAVPIYAFKLWCKVLAGRKRCVHNMKAAALDRTLIYRKPVVSHSTTCKFSGIMAVTRTWKLVRWLPFRKQSAIQLCP